MSMMQAQSVRLAVKWVQKIKGLQTFCKKGTLFSLPYVIIFMEVHRPSIFVFLQGHPFAFELFFKSGYR